MPNGTGESQNASSEDSPDVNMSPPAEDLLNKTAALSRPAPRHPILKGAPMGRNYRVASAEATSKSNFPFGE